MAIRELGHHKVLIRIYTGRDPVTKRRRGVNETFRGTRREAEKREQVLKVEAHERPKRGSPNMTVSDLVTLYLKATANRRTALTNIRLRYSFDRYVLPHIGGLRISKVDTSVIQQLLDFLSAPRGEGHK